LKSTWKIVSTLAQHVDVRWDNVHLTTRITLLFVRLWTIYSVICTQYGLGFSHTVANDLATCMVRSQLTLLTVDCVCSCVQPAKKCPTGMHITSTAKVSFVFRFFVAVIQSIRLYRRARRNF